MPDIQKRNQKFLESLQGNIGKYLSFLSTMARFHKYEVADLTSFAIEAPAMFTAVANKELWERHFRRKIKPNAKGVTLIKDGKETVYYDVSETESAIKNEIEVKLWHFDNSVHKKFLDAVVSDEKSTEKQIKIIAEELANRTDIDDKSKKILALSVESVILERMGFSTENATRQLAKISFKDHDIPKILNETQTIAKIFLDAMQKSVTKNASENLDLPENNPLLEKIGVIKLPEKIQETELKLEVQEEIVQNGLFDEVVDSQVSEKSEEKIVEEIQTAEDNSEEVSVQNSEVVDAELVEKKVLEEISTVEENSESTTTSDAENISEELEKNISEKISTQNPEVIDAEFVEKNPAEIFETDEQNNSDYNFEEMDEEEEIFPDSSEQQNNVEILTENNSEQNSAIEKNSDVEIATETSENEVEQIEVVEDTPDEIKSDLQTVLAEDMAVIRGNNFEKNIFRKNVTAIRTLQFIEKENRAATPEEIEVLKNYSGFGGIPKAFDKNDPNWNREAWLLQSMLTEKEYSDARGSTLNAHYTSKEIVQGIYGGLQNLGFQQGTILEPSMGVGGFFGNMPDEMKNGSHLFGVELDSITGRIAQKIYPDAEISVQGFEDTRYLNNSFDIAVGNVPFGNYRVNDKGYNKHYFLIHDYFIAKMIDQVRSGGLVAVITSRGTLDKQDSRARKFFARRADLVRAIRLPNNAFKEAGTEVTGDILFFKKLENVRDDENLPSWVNVNYFQGEHDITINSYFEEHPEDILGTLDKTSTAYGFDLTCKPDENRSLAEMLNESMQSMQKIYSPSQTALPLPKQIADIDDKRSSSFFVENGELKFFNGVKTDNIKVNAKDRSQILLAMDLRDSVRNVIDIQVDDGSDDELQKAQVELNKIYDNFVTTYGHICEDSNLKKIFSRDSAYPLLRSLEEYGKDGYKGKSPIFSKRMIEPHRRPTHADNPADSLAISMQEIGYVDLEYMQSLTGKSEEEIIKALEFERIYFDFQYHEFQIAEEFLSGDIRAKIEFAENKIKQNDDEISKKIAENVLNISPVPAYEPKNELERKILTCNPDGDRYFSFARFYDDDKQIYYDDYIETQKNNRDFLVEVALRQGISMYTDTVGELLADKPLIALEAIRRGRDVGYVRQADLLINGYLRTLDEEFSRTDAEHDLLLYSFLKKNLAKFENNLDAIKEQVDNFYQSIGADELKNDWENFKADYQNQKNIELDKLNPALDFVRSQKSRLENKRLGLTKKSMIVVPKHLTEQFGTEFLQLYPNAKILVATAKDFSAENRKEFCSKIATQDWDAVIMGYTQFEKIPISKERLETMLQQQVDELVDAIQEMRDEHCEKFSIKQAELKKKSLLERLESLQNEKTDDTITFEQLGIDRLYVDEAHYYKNLFTYTKMQNIPGISTTDAKKTTDMFEKCRYLNEINHGKCGIVFASGTPLSNSMCELYTMQRYLQPDRLKEEGLGFFDSWASNFGKTVTAVELSPEGKGFRTKTRFAKFHNLPELMAMFKEIADIKTADQLNLDVPHAEFIVTKVSASDAQKEMVDALAERAKRVREKLVEPEEDNMLKITNDGRKLALDQRLINPDLPDDPDSKVNMCVKNVLEIYESTKAQHSTQMIFCDQSTPSPDKFNVYDDIREKLINAGVKPDEIAFIQSAKNEKEKDALFDKVRKGKVRILLGSTVMMGTGTNVQDKLIALHDLDVPWRPSDLEQRAGRIIRQGNENKNVKIFRYVTESTFDSYLWVRREAA